MPRDSIARLRRIAAALEAGRAPDAGDGAWLSDRLRRYLESASRGATMDICLGLAPMPGEVSWWTDEAAEARDGAIRELAKHFFSGRRPGTQAREIERLFLRYATASWRFDRDRDTMPERYCGTATAHLWRANKSGAAMPLQRRQIETILKAEKKDTAA